MPLHKFQAVNPSHEAKRVASRSRGSDAMTQDQKNYIADLIKQRDQDETVQEIRASLNACLENRVLVTKAHASQIIDALKLCALNPRPQAPSVTKAVEAIADHEEGESTLAAFTGEQPKWLGKFALGEEPNLVFYQVDRPTKGKWKGWVFVKKLTGSPGEWRKDRIRGQAADEILRQIAENPMEAQRKYGLHHAECGRCASPLSNPCSRAAGYGEICAGHNGWPYPSPSEAMQILTDRFGVTEAQRIISEHEAQKG